MTPKPRAASTGNSAGWAMRSRTSLLYAASPDARSLHACEHPLDGGGEQGDDAEHEDDRVGDQPDDDEHARRARRPIGHRLGPAPGGRRRTR